MCLLLLFPNLDGVWCDMDGLKMLLQNPGDKEMQNAHYNGWLHNHIIGYVFGFAPSGIVAACMLNTPGSWDKKLHESTVARRIRYQAAFIHISAEQGMTEQFSYRLKGHITDLEGMADHRGFCM
jgi:hypothetical protein